MISGGLEEYISSSFLHIDIRGAEDIREGLHINIRELK